MHLWIVKFLKKQKLKCASNSMRIRAISMGTVCFLRHWHYIYVYVPLYIKYQLTINNFCVWSPSA